MIATRGVAVLGIALLASLGSPAMAQTAQSTADRASELFDKGNALYKQSRWAEAWDIRKSFDLAANLGDCELQIGQNREAAEHLAYAVREFPLSGKPALRERLQQRFAEARARVGALRVRVSVPGAEVTADGHVVGVAPLAEEVFVDPGAHVLEARLGDYETGRASVEVGPGGSREVALALVRKREGGVGGEESKKALVIGGAALTGLALVTGTVLAVVAHAKASDATAKTATLPQPGATSPCVQQASVCGTIDNDWASRDRLSNASMGVFIGAGAVGLATLGYGLFAPRAQRATGLRLLPSIGASQGGAVLTGAW
jgi:PEGA domain